VQSTSLVPGDLVWIRQCRWRIERVRRDRRSVAIDVTARGRRQTFLTPFDRPAPIATRLRIRAVRPQQALARLAALLARSHGIRSIASAIDARVAILPHQLEPALAIIAGTRRILVADEVGLGKTIQAGFAIAELVRREPAARVLVIVPAALRQQWRGELGHRFDLECRLADRDLLDDLGREGARGDDPWRRSGLWIASSDYLKQPHVRHALPAQPWDLVVIDEAHTACGDSERHDICDANARRSRHVVLLTATPHDGDAERFARLLGLGMLDGISDELTVFRRVRADLGGQRLRRIRWHRVGLSEPERCLLSALGEFERAIVIAAGDNRREHALLLLSVFRKRALSSVRALAISLQRRLTWISSQADATATVDWQQPSLIFDEDSDDVDRDERASLSHDVDPILEVRHEISWLKRLLTLASAAQRRESKIERLAALIGRAREPVVVFTEFRHSLEALRLRLERAMPLAVLHGGQVEGERQSELARFLSGRASVLLATDVASLGLNLQTRARWVVSLELPWNPARLEQRAGRVDRIGQNRPVHVTLLVARHEAETAVLERIARRTLTARQSLGDNVLAAAVPAELVREQLFSGRLADVPATASTGPPLARAWVLQARAMARALEKRRALLGHWRSNSPGRSCAHRAVVSRTCELSHLVARQLLVFQVPIVDATGEVVEATTAAIRVSERCNGQRLRDLIDLTAERASVTTEPRRRRVARLRQQWSRVARERERALIDRIAADRHMGEAQPGLFDRRVSAALDRSTLEVADLRRDLAARLTTLEQRSAISIGRPTLMFVFESRR
jgi:superfamily II DNA or RNA helicase